MKKLLLAVSTFSLVSFPMAHLTLKGGMASSTPKIESDGTAVTTTAANGIKGGAVLGLGLGSSVEFEFGVLYSQRKFGYDAAGIPITITTPGLEMPIGLRLHLGQYFSLVGGGYVGYGMGNIKVEALGITQEASYAEQGYETLDYGVQGGLAIHIPMGKSAALVLEGRYLLGLQDLDKSEGKYNYKGIEGTLGLRFGL